MLQTLKSKSETLFSAFAWHKSVFFDFKPKTHQKNNFKTESKSRKGYVKWKINQPIRIKV